MKTKSNLALLAMTAMLLPMASCSDDDTSYGEGTETDASYVGKGNAVFSADEWYPGGQLGTTDNATAGDYQDETPAVEQDNDLFVAFHKGEALFERNYNTGGTPPFGGLGPAYLRASCIDCHPGYGHGKAQPDGILRAQFGNGYLMAIYHPNGDGSNNFSGSDGNSNNGGYITEVTGMPQQKAASPFLAPIDEDQIRIQWHDVTSMPSGLPMHFPDGETFSLHYPSVTIPTTAFNTDPQPSNIAIRLESTIGIIGTGLIDAIPQDSIIKQYEREAAYFEQAHGIDSVKYFLNPNMWDATNRTMASSAFYSNWTSSGALADGTKVTSMLKRYTYALTRASLQDGPGANAIWNITNVSRSDRPHLYSTEPWAKKMSETQSVINAIKADPTSVYYASTDEGIREKVYNLLLPTTNQFNNQWSGTSIQPEQDDDSYYAFMVWHRGLAIPRARNLNNADVQRGKTLFYQMGCTSCHRPSWTTGDDNYWVSDNIKNRPLPKYPHQKIYPYSDFIQHKLDMINDIHGSWCRTTPLWGRGLSLANTGAEERLHDCRARNEVEAIMWHCYSKNSQAYWSAIQFYNLPKADRDAVVKFLRSI